ncbi:hypothetical protein GCM10027174_06490 [Salinifilum aidingensis]
MRTTEAETAQLTHRRSTSPAGDPEAPAHPPQLPRQLPHSRLADAEDEHHLIRGYD